MAPRTRNSYIPLGVVTRGLGSVDPSGGSGRATRGLIQEYPEGIAPAPEFGVPVPLLSTVAIDGNGIQRLLSDDIVALHFAHAAQQSFSNPDREYTGYAANGFWYTEGLLDPTHVPFKATWASEGEAAASINRGALDRMPARLIVAATPFEVALFDADTLNLWMRFEIGLVAPAAQGKLAGKPSTKITEIRYANGFLVIATNEGLRIADFRNDRGLLLLSTGSHLSTGGLELRNDSTFLDGATSVSSDVQLQNDSCLSMDVGTLSTEFQSGSTKGNRTIVAVGHPDGITAVQLDNPTFPIAKCVRHAAALVVATGWEVEDDVDLDTTSPYFVDDSFGSTAWENLGVRAGDFLTPTPLGEKRITRVESIVPGRRLSVTPELGLTDTGGSYSIRREVRGVFLSPELHLYFSNGSHSIAVVRDATWITTPGIWVNLNTAGNSESAFAATVTAVNGMAKRGDTLLVATSLGVFSVTDEELDSRKLAPFRYSTAAVTSVDADFKILEGEDSNCAAVSVDPETGNIMVAVTDSASVVSEINPSIEQAFRYFDNVGRIKALASFRNPTGPPDVPPEEAP